MKGNISGMQCVREIAQTFSLPTQRTISQNVLQQTQETR